MNKSTNKVLIDRVQKLTGHPQCSDVVVLQVRARWAMPLAIGLMLVAAVLAKVLFDPSTLVSAIIVGTVGGLSSMLLQGSHLLARCGESVVLIRSWHPLTGSEVVVDEWPVPVVATIDGGIVIKRVTVAGKTYSMVGSHAGRLTSVTT